MKNLVIIDMQNDFMDDGVLPVNGAYKARDIIELYIEDYYDEIGIVICSQDCHPINHCSFKEFGGNFNKHCICNTEGALTSIDPYVLSGLLVFDVRKGTRNDQEQFSVFSSCFRVSNNYVTLENPFDKSFEHLNRHDEYVVCGVAGDICVLETLKDMVKYIPVENITVLWNGTASLDKGTKLEQFCVDNEIKIDYYGKEYEKISK